MKSQGGNVHWERTKRTYSGIFSNNTERIKKKEAFARRLNRSGQGDQMTIKKDDVEEVKNEKEGLFSRVKCCGRRSSKTKTMRLHSWQKWFQGTRGLVSDGDRSQVAELMREEKMRRRVPMPVLFYYSVLASSIPFVCI